MTEYSYSDKTFLFNKLNKITDKNQIRDIIKIIMFKDKEHIFEKDIGTYIKFNNLNNNTYKELEQYIDSLQFKNNKNDNIISLNNDKILSFTEDNY